MVANDDDYYEPNQITKHHVSQFKGRADSEAWSTYLVSSGRRPDWVARCRPQSPAQRRPIPAGARAEEALYALDLNIKSFSDYMSVDGLDNESHHGEEGGRRQEEEERWEEKGRHHLR